MDSPIATPAAEARPDGIEWRRLARAVRQVDSAPRLTEVPRADPALLRADGTPARVLIVDGDDATRLVYSLKLQLKGIVVLETAGGRDGFELARTEHPDLLLTDVTPPGLDGFQLAAALRSDERTRAIPLIFVSAEATADDKARAYELGALAYLTKPVDVRAIASLVAGVLDRSRPRTPPTPLRPAKKASQLGGSAA
jgi:CheY-like chemotaxis protein